MPVGPTDSQGRPLAEWWQRLVAIILDGIILTIPEDIILRVAINTRDRSLVSSRHLVASVVILSLVFAIVNIVYFAVLNGSGRGQTVGQMALGISVRDEASGGPIGVGRAALRILILLPGLLLDWLLPIIALIAFLYSLVAAFSPLWDARRQGFHDKVAHTVVIKVR